MTGESHTENCSHSSMSGVVRRRLHCCTNCSGRTSSTSEHWSLADGWAATCPSHPTSLPSSWIEECISPHYDFQRFQFKTTSSVFLQKGGRNYLSQLKAQGKVVAHLFKHKHYKCVGSSPLPPSVIGKFHKRSSWTAGVSVSSPSCPLTVKSLCL